MATIYDVAKKAGVSITTVSRVINNHPYVKESTRKKVEAFLEDMHYIPNSNASSLVSKSTNTIAIIVPDVTNNFFTTLLRGTEDKANQNGFAVILGNTDEDINKEQTYIRMFIERRVDGIIIDSVSAKGENLKAVLKHKIPLVLIDREVEGLSVDYVGSDNQVGAQKIVDYLIDLGHERIALISASQEISVFKKRTEGYLTSLSKAGLPINENYIKYGSKPVKDVGYLLTRDLLTEDSPPTAIFAANNFLAIGAYNAFREANLTVPEDIAIVCYDVYGSDSVINPFFTSINQPAYMMGQIAVDLLIRQIKDNNPSPTKVLLESDLCIRDSGGVELEA